MSDPVNHPSHYKKYPFEVKDAIEVLLGMGDIPPYDAYCLGNELKYRLRAGFKGTDLAQQDIDKAMFYYKERTGLDKDEE